MRPCKVVAGGCGVPEQKDENRNVHVLEFFEVDVVLGAGAHELFLHSDLQEVSANVFRERTGAAGARDVP